LASVKVRKTCECDRFPRARTSFERAPHFRTTRFASVGDILKTVGKQIGVTSLIVISLLHFGQISIVGTTEHASFVLMTFPFARQNVGAAKRLTLEWVPANLKSKSWKLAGSLCDSGSIANIMRLWSARVEEK
jgi:hypothetical protein